MHGISRRSFIRTTVFGGAAIALTPALLAVDEHKSLIEKALNAAREG